MNTDAEVMRHFPAMLSQEESDAFVDRIEDHWRAHGFGLFAVEERASGDFIGFIGLAVPRFSAAFTPCVEVGWRLAHNVWGQGYAPEGAREALAFGYETASLTEIVSFTSATNLPSQRVMEKIGMRHDPAEDFDHPSVAASSPLCRHVLYRLRRDNWAPLR